MCHVLPDHFYVGGSSDPAFAGLYDTRKPSGYAKPIRPNYRYTHADIRSVADLKATLRAREYAWPGGYPMYLLCSDGGSLCFSCGRKEFRMVADSIRRDIADGWRVVGCDINWEDASLYCDHCSQRIESAYADNDDDASETD